MRKHLLLLQQTSDNNYSIKRFKKEAKFLNIDFTHAKYSDLNLEFTADSVLISLNGKNLVEDYDYFIFRSGSADDISYKYLYKPLRYVVKANGKPALNYDFSIYHNHQSTKIYTYFVLTTHGIPVIPTKLFVNQEKFEKQRKLFNLPIIAKLTTGSHGDGVNLINTEDQLTNITNKYNIQDILFQEFIDTTSDERSDLRILTLGDKVLGAFERYVDKSKVITNYSAGGEIRKYELTSELSDLALKISKIMNADYCGIDIIFKDGRPLVLEVNSAPQFKGFEKVTGINVARKLIEYTINL